MRKKRDEAGQGGSGALRITPQDVQEKEFRLAFRGYNERDVDRFLDDVTEAMTGVMEENRRLREQVASGTGAAGAEPGSEGGEDVVGQAREEADRIVREAEERAARIVASAEPLSSGDRQAIGAFISKEREFLQGLASLVQSHAEGVKEMARRARERAQAEPAPEPAPEPAEPAAEPAPEAAREPSTETAPEPMIWVPEAAPAPVEEAPTEASVERQDVLEDQSMTATAQEDTGAEPAPVPGSGGEQERDRPRREGSSLRELFWGEE